MRSLIYLIRHGEINKPSARSFLGQTDLPLSDKGIHQANALGAQLQNVPFTKIFSSPLKRAIQTAALASGMPPAALQLIDAFKEINLGAWEGLPVAEVRALFPEAYEQRGQDLEFFRPPGGESFADLATRSYPALLALAEDCRGPLLVVTHAGVIRVLLSCVQQKPLQQLFDIPQNYCGINIISCDANILKVEAVNLLNIP